MADDHLYLMVRGVDLDRVVGALEGILKANAQLAAFHTTRRPDLTSGEAAARAGAPAGA